MEKVWKIEVSGKGAYNFRHELSAILPVLFFMNWICLQLLYKYICYIKVTGN